MERYYHRDISAEHAEGLLKSNRQNGYFLLRDSETLPGAHCLSVYADGLVKHYRICKEESEDGILFSIQTDGKNKGPGFPDIPNLIEVYMEIGEVNGLIGPLSFPLAPESNSSDSTASSSQSTDSDKDVYTDAMSAPVRKRHLQTSVSSSADEAGYDIIKDDDIATLTSLHPYLNPTGNASPDNYYEAENPYLLPDLSADNGKRYTTKDINLATVGADYLTQAQLKTGEMDMLVCDIAMETDRNDDSIFATLVDATQQLGKNLQNFQRKLRRYVIEKGSEIWKLQNKNKMTILTFASYFYKNEIIKCFEEFDVDWELLDGNGMSAIHYASKKGNREMIEYLVDLGVNIQQRGRGKNTALHFASANARIVTLSKLLEFAADATLKNGKNETALDLCKQLKNKSQNTRNMEKKLEVAMIYHASSSFKSIRRKQHVEKEVGKAKKEILESVFMENKETKAKVNQVAEDLEVYKTKADEIKQGVGRLEKKQDEGVQKITKHMEKMLSKESKDTPTAEREQGSNYGVQDRSTLPQKLQAYRPTLFGNIEMKRHTISDFSTNRTCTSANYYHEISQFIPPVHVPQHWIGPNQPVLIPIPQATFAPGFEHAAAFRPRFHTNVSDSTTAANVDQLYETVEPNNMPNALSKTEKEQICNNFNTFVEKAKITRIAAKLAGKDAIDIKQLEKWRCAGLTDEEVANELLISILKGNKEYCKILKEVLKEDDQTTVAELLPDIL